MIGSSIILGGSDTYRQQQSLDSSMVSSSFSENTKVNGKSIRKRLFYLDENDKSENIMGN
jgi:hypothetical protein